MKLLSAVLTGCLLALPALAIAQDVKIDYDKAFNFAPVKTYAIKIGTTWGNPLGEKCAIAEIEQELTKKGWSTAEETAADAIVILHGATSQKHSLNTFYSGYGGGYRWGGWGGTMSTATTTVHEYTVGTMVVDIYDAKSKNLVFRGIAQDELSDKPEKNVKKMEKASEKLFKKFPPGSEDKK